jgi:hypothetical protein
MTRGRVLAVRRRERAALSESLWKGVRGRTFLPRKVSPGQQRASRKTELAQRRRATADLRHDAKDLKVGAKLLSFLFPLSSFPYPLPYSLVDVVRDFVL